MLPVEPAQPCCPPEVLSVGRQIAEDQGEVTMAGTSERDSYHPQAQRRKRLLQGQGQHLLNAGYLSFIVFGTAAQTLTDWVRRADTLIWLPATVPLAFVIVGAAVQSRDKRAR
jgi:hypothetical protein